MNTQTTQATQATQTTQTTQTTQATQATPTTQADNSLRLTQHFTLREMTASATAIRLKIDNTPGASETENLRQLCLNVLEPLRRRFGVVRITSGYRCEQLNSAVHGVPGSQHTRGEAADIHMSSHQQAQQWADYISQHLHFDQLIIEKRLSNGCCWLHVSYVSQPGRRPNRHQRLNLSV